MLLQMRCIYSGVILPDLFDSLYSSGISGLEASDSLEVYLMSHPITVY